jgi:hypothetical protein
MSAIAFSKPTVVSKLPPKAIFVQESDWSLWVADNNGVPRKVKAGISGEFTNYVEQVLANEDGTFTRKYSEIKQLVDLISLRVGQVEYDTSEMDARLSQAEASIQITARQIENKVWQDDFAIFRGEFDTIEAVIRSLSSKITQTASSISQRVRDLEYEVVRRDDEYISQLVKKEESERIQTAKEITERVSKSLFDLEGNLESLIFSEMEQLADQITSIVGEFTPGGELCELLVDYVAPGTYACSELVSPINSGDIVFIIPTDSPVPVNGTITANADAGDTSVAVDFGAGLIPEGSKIYISSAYLYSKILQTKDEIDLSVNQIDDRTLGMVLGITSGTGSSTNTINLASTLPIGLFVDDVVTIGGVRHTVTADRTTSQSTILVTPNVTYIADEEVILSSVSGKGMVSRINLSPAGVKIQGKLISIDGDTTFSAGFGPADVTAAARRRILVSATGTVSVTHDAISVTGISFVLGDGTTWSPANVSVTFIGSGATRYLFGNVDTGVAAFKVSAVGLANEVLLLTATTGAESGVSGSYVWQGGSTVISGNRIVTGSITASQIKAGTITATQIAAGTITADKIQAGTITADRLNAGVITSITNDVNTAVAKKILVAVRGTITATNTTISWTSVNILLGSGTTLSPSNGSVGSLGPNVSRYLCVNVDTGVLTARTNTGDITSSEVLIATATTSVDAAYAGTVVLQAGSTVISGSTIVADSIVGSKIRAGTITADKLAGSVISTIADSVEPDVIEAIAFNTIVRVHGSLSVTQNSVTFTSVALTYGDLWADFLTGFTSVPAGSSYNSGTGVLSGLSQNTSYVIYATRVSVAGFTARVAVEGTNPGANEKRVGTFKTGNADSNNVGSYQFTSGQVVIAGNAIVAGSITATQIKAGTITATQISANAITADKIQAGAVTASKINVTDLSAIGATIGGWVINTDHIYKSTTTTLKPGSSFESLSTYKSTKIRTDGVAEVAFRDGASEFSGTERIVGVGNWGIYWYDYDGGLYRVNAINNSFLIGTPGNYDITFSESTNKWAIASPLDVTGVIKSQTYNVGRYRGRGNTTTRGALSNLIEGDLFVTTGLEPGGDVISIYTNIGWVNTINP